jgi:hypothetical protein
MVLIFFAVICRFMEVISIHVYSVYVAVVGLFPGVYTLELPLWGVGRDAFYVVCGKWPRVLVRVRMQYLKIQC